MPLPSSWSVDGKIQILTVFSLTGGTGLDIDALSMDGDRKLTPLLREKYNEAMPDISPDGRWMAYVSDVSGQLEVYVRPFPDVNKELYRVSTSGGDSPLWSPDGRELFYRSGDSAMTVALQTEPTLKPGKPEVLFRGNYVSLLPSLPLLSWDISPDGKRFLMMKEPEAVASTNGGPRKINIVLNWFEELKQRVPVK